MVQKQHIGGQFNVFLKSKSLLSVIVIANVAIWILTLFFPMVDYLFARPEGYTLDVCYDWLALSSQIEMLPYRPWTLLSYMFLHAGLWHVLFNMVMLYFGGIMCCRYLGSRRFGWIYFLSGLAGALLYLLVYNVFPVGRLGVSTIVGASAAVLGVFIAVAVYLPEQEVAFWMLRTFSVKLKYLAIAFVVIDLLSISVSNAGGHIAHLGGALFGFLYVVVMRWRSSHGGAGHVNRGFFAQRRQQKIRKKQEKTARQGRPLTDDEYNRRRAADQKRVDSILDKISKSGYENLTKEEKEFLFKYKA